jgi:hypothetical protein
MYEQGVADAIRDDLRRYDLRDYLPQEMLDRLEDLEHQRVQEARADA